MPAARRRLAAGARPRAAASALAVLLAAVCVRCTESVQLGENFVSVPDASLPGAGGQGAAGQGGLGGIDLYPIDPLADAGQPPPVVPSGECERVRCGGMERACGNCSDDDQDGLVDAADPECLGPCDDSEAELFTGESMRVNGSCRSDCFFDLNVGGGDDGCDWSLSCDPLAPAEWCPFDGDQPRCQMDARRSNACRQGCLPLTPNGCDCFGCCELPANSGNFIWLGSETAQGGHCELVSSADPSACRPCTPVPECQNDCAPCELCVGKTELPASCGGGVGVPQCNPGVTPCDPDEPGACGRLHYCITGCCVPLPR